jgi:hypothetical protein
MSLVAFSLGKRPACFQVGRNIRGGCIRRNTCRLGQWEVLDQYKARISQEVVGIVSSIVVVLGSE